MTERPLRSGKATSKMVGSTAVVVHAPLPKDDPVRRISDIMLTKKRPGGWMLQVPLECGLESTIAYSDTSASR